MTTTQYGKSLIVAVALIIKTIVSGDTVPVVAPSEKKAGIIMKYVIDHIFDDDFFISQLQLDSTEKLDRLRRERSKNSISWLNGGGIHTLTMDAANGKKALEAAMGHGGRLVVVDESCLLNDSLYATMKRMLGGHQYNKQLLIELGNPFYRNHFYRTWNSSRYQKIFVPWQRAVAEGRLSQEFVDEMSEEALFDILYACEFPPEGSIDENGYRQLITSSIYEKSLSDTQIFYDPAELRLGVDIGGGSDESVFAIRSDDQAWLESKFRSDDTMANVSEVLRIMNEYKIPDQNVYIDDIGIGRGVSDRLKEKGLHINGVSVGERARDDYDNKFYNMKAQNYWHFADWLKAGGQLLGGNGAEWEQLLNIRYKITSEKVIQIEPKQDMKKRLGRSPDHIEALMLTFTMPERSVEFFSIG